MVHFSWPQGVRAYPVVVIEALRAVLLPVPWLGPRCPKSSPPHRAWGKIESMVLTIGKVVDGKVVIEGTVLPEGSVVGVLIGEEDGAGFVLSPADETELLERVRRAAGGDATDAEMHLRQLRAHAP